MQKTIASDELNSAKAYYGAANLSAAHTHALKAFELLFSAYKINPSDTENAYQLLDALTLLQSLLALLHQPEEYLSHLPLWEELIYLLFKENTNVYLALHLFDVCDHMAANSYLKEAKDAKEHALFLLKKESSSGTYVPFMEACNNAKIAFHMEDYYACIEACNLANSLWYTEQWGQAFPPYFDRTPQAEAAIDAIGTNNLLLLCNAYGKINNPLPAIKVLEDLLEQRAFSDFPAVSAEITLATLYAIHRDYENSRKLYQKYIHSPYMGYPDVATALINLAFLLEEQPILPTPGTYPMGYCPGHDGLDALRYNRALALTSHGEYEQAMDLFRSLKEKGYSMALALYSLLNRQEEIPAMHEKVNRYFYRRCNEIIQHYNEELAYNHLSQLQYHIDLCLNAYCDCLTKNPDLLSPRDAYAFLLNTKYISLEVSYLKQRNVERPIHNTEAVCRTLPRDTLLLEYTTIRSLENFSESYGVFLVSNLACHYIPLSGKEETDALLSEWRELLLSSQVSSGTERDMLLGKQKSVDAKLRRILFLPIKSYVEGFRNLIIAPAGDLVNFPFCRLTVSSGVYLGDTHFLSYVNTGKELCLEQMPSVSDYQTALTDFRRNPLIVGNPATLRYPRLPHADAEADMVSFFMQCAPYKGNQVTRELFKANSAHGVLHIAAHGVYQSLSDKDRDDWTKLYRTLQNSGIILSEDTLLSCIDLSALNCSDTRLAVLSCCHSGQGNYQSAEGIYGLRRTLKLAGCKAVILNLWQTDDAAALLWMQHFYQALTISCCDIQAAFNHATSSVRTYEENGICPFEDPYFWAGYILLQ